MPAVPFLWLIAIPLLASPLIYLSGRLARFGRRGGGGAGRYGLPFWIALFALGISWAPFVQSVLLFNQAGPVQVDLDAIPLRLDGLSLLLSAVALGLGTLAVLFTAPPLAGEAGEEKYYTMLTAMVGVMIALSCAADLFNLWVWFEAMAVSSYLLVVFHRDQPASLEAGVKYVVQSAAGSILVLLGIALVLAQTGTLDLGRIQAAARPSGMLLAAGALFTAGFGIKIALVPFHTWLPDAHTQAPSGISAMLSGVVIEAGLVALLRALSALAGVTNAWGLLLMLFGAANMLLGNLMALRQRQVKRLLAYSSLSHVGYMVLGLGIAAYAGQAAGAQGGLFHLFNHGLMKGLAFFTAGAFLYALHTAAGDHGPLTISDLSGAARRYPLPALALSLALLGLGGLPPLAGFMSKWQIFAAGFAAQDIMISTLVVFAALNSVLSLAYYAPVVNIVYRRQPSPAVEGGAPIPVVMSLPLGLLSLAILAIGLWPGLVQWLTGPAGSALLAAFK